MISTALMILMVVCSVVSIVIIVAVGYVVVRYVRGGQCQPPSLQPVDVGKLIQCVADNTDRTQKSVSDIVTLCENMSSSIPRSVLSTITSAANPRKGKLGELITLCELTGKYRMLIPLGQPVDFIGISDDSIDFIEVKTGKSRLTENEKIIRKIVESRNVNFVSVSTDVVINGAHEHLIGG